MARVGMFTSGNTRTPQPLTAVARLSIILGRFPRFPFIFRLFVGILPALFLKVAGYAFKNKAGNRLNNTQNLHRRYMNRLGFKETDALASNTRTNAKQHTYFYRIVEMVFRAIRCHAHYGSGAV